jgi:predicted helicase
VAKIFHADLHGLSGVKDKALLTLDIAKTNWSSVNIEASSSYLLIPQNSDLRHEYDRGWKVTDIFAINSVGIVTGQDSKTIATRRADAEALAKGHNLSTSIVKQILYRPFDLHHIVYDSTVVTRTRSKVMKHMLAGDNLGLIIPKQTKEKWDVLTTNQIIGHKSLAAYDINSLFPLYLYPITPAEIEMGITRKPNISAEFLTELEQNFGCIPTPEGIFCYIYAIFHSPTYRTRYAEFLKSDFPHVFLTHNNNLFRQLAEYGEQLVALHLMKPPLLEQQGQLLTFVENGGGGIVDSGHLKYAGGKVIINSKQDCFVDVPEEVWNFHVGGYQVCHQWLKDRKGRTLSPDDISHYQKTVVALGQTIELMTKIDEAIPDWPIQ